MYQPDIYERLNRAVIVETTRVYKEYGHLIKWREDSLDSIMDIGCGPGNVLINVILPNFKGKYAMVYGSDISEKMIEFCNQKYKSEMLNFLTMDIMEDTEKFVEKYGQLDHVVSSYALHWLSNQPKGIRNIYNLLKPGGDFFSIHIQSSVLYEIMAYMDKNKKWCKYFDKLTECIPFSQNSTQPERDFFEILENNGFTDIMVEIAHQDVVLNDYDDMVAFLGTIVCQVDRIPEDKRREYIKDFLDYGLDNGLITTLPSGEVSYAIQLYISYATKME